MPFSTVSPAGEDALSDSGGMMRKAGGGKRLVAPAEALDAASAASASEVDLDAALWAMATTATSAETTVTSSRGIPATAEDNSGQSSYEICGAEMTSSLPHPARKRGRVEWRPPPPALLRVADKYAGVALRLCDEQRSVVRVIGDEDHETASKEDERPDEDTLSQLLRFAAQHAVVGAASTEDAMSKLLTHFQASCEGGNALREADAWEALVCTQYGMCWRSHRKLQHELQQWHQHLQQASAEACPKPHATHCYTWVMPPSDRRSRCTPLKTPGKRRATLLERQKRIDVCLRLVALALDPRAADDASKMQWMDTLRQRLEKLEQQAAEQQRREAEAAERARRRDRDRQQKELERQMRLAARERERERKRREREQREREQQEKREAEQRRAERANQSASLLMRFVSRTAEPPAAAIAASRHARSTSPATRTTIESECEAFMRRARLVLDADCTLSMRCEAGVPVRERATLAQDLLRATRCVQAASRERETSIRGTAGAGSLPAVLAELSACRGAALGVAWRWRRQRGILRGDMPQHRPDEDVVALAIPGIASSRQLVSRLVRPGLKYLQFAENVRPAYHGPWPLLEQVPRLRPRRPWVRLELDSIAYDEDSDTEWAAAGDDDGGGGGEDLLQDTDDAEEEEEEEEDMAESGSEAVDSSDFIHDAPESGDEEEGEGSDGGDCAADAVRAEAPAPEGRAARDRPMRVRAMIIAAALGQPAVPELTRYRSVRCPFFHEKKPSAATAADPANAEPPATDPPPADASPPRAAYTGSTEAPPVLVMPVRKVDAATVPAELLCRLREHLQRSTGLGAADAAAVSFLQQEQDRARGVSIHHTVARLERLIQQHARSEPRADGQWEWVWTEPSTNQSSASASIPRHANTSAFTAATTSSEHNAKSV
eukprot:ctg_29.g12